MPTHLTSSDAPSWRRPNQPSSPPQPVSAHSQRDLHAHRKDKDKPHENWRVHAQPVAAPSKSHQYPSLQAQPLSISAPRTKPARAHASSCTSASASTAHQTEAIPSLLSTSLNREKSSVLDAHWVPGRHPHPDPNAPHAIKPSGIGNGIIGRAPEFGTSPIKTKGAAFPAIRPHWPLSSSLEKHVNSGPATHLHPLRIEPNERSRFFPSASTPLKPNQNNYSALKSHSSLYSHDRDENWMLTPTSSLPSIPSTPNHLRESSTERLLAATPQLAPPPHTPNARPLPSIRGPVDQFQASLNSAPRTPSPSYPFGRPDAAHAGPSLFNRGPSVNVLSSPKRSPLVVSAYPHRQQATTATANPVLLSPTSSPKLSHRTLSPMTRLPPAIPESHLPTSSDRVVNSIASMLSSVSPQPRPCSASRRDSFNSVTSVSAGHALSHSRRSSAVFSPNSPTVSTRVGVYRPPHLRNRDSVSGLKPSVAHYDRVRTPSLRGLSRSRESSISLSRPTSRPPSTVPFHHSESIPEDGQADDAARTLLRGRQSNLSIHLPDLIAEEQLRNAAAAAAVSATSVSDNDHNDSFVANTTHLLEQPLDSASLLAKLRAQLVRREAAASDAAASDADRNSVILDDNGHEFFDLSEMMEYGASDIHPLSRCSSMSAIEGPPLGDVFEIGDLLGPGLEHDGHIIQIAETTPGFVDQNEDLTGSKLEVVRKLGEGSYAVVYLVKEVSAQEAASNPLQKSVAIPSSSSRNTNTDLEASSKNLDDDADLTMVASSEDMLSTTLKANANAKDQGFHNSPALEERRRKDLKINTHMRPGKEFALKCLCKRDLPEDMLEVQRLEATIHQSIPSHPNIVTLYRTYETPDWLFLVLEYCPGQDLYYWLEQAQDEGRPAEPAGNMYANTFVDRDEVAATLKGSSTASSDDNYRVLGTSLDATPPSPSLLASTSGHSLLSKRRIRLIARMFRQICDAVQFCHDRGVSHRDIKPENFIVEDRRTLEEMQSACPDTSASTLVDGFRDGDETQVIVKMTDFGLATAEDRCDDFDCGSKPYMAFECHNNISSSYDPKQADIWSLGVVLLNLLFHRSPFTEPSMSCPSFSAYCQDPIRFLMESFDGLTETVARFLSENVFCSISDDDDVTQKRVSAGEFSRWACSLVDHMGLSGPGSGRISRGASIHSTIPLIHSRTASMSTLPSLLSSPRPRARSLARDTDHIPDLDVTADATFRAAFAAAATRQGNMFPNPALFTPDVLPSPTFTPSPHPPEQNPFDTQYGAAEEAARCTETSVEQEEHDNSGHLHNSAFDSPSGANVAKRQTINPDSLGSERINPVTHPASEGKEGAHDISNNLLDTEVSADISSPKKSDVPVEAEPAPASSDTGGEGDVPDEAEQVTSADGGGGALGETEDGDKAESITMSNHSKRRKRGARKGRTLAKQLKRSQSVEGMTEADANDPAAKARERERTIRELALASETLARQMSKMTKPSDSIDVLVSPQITLSKPTAEAAARFNLQGLVDAEVESANMRVAKSGDDGLAANWSSAAMRRERMSEQRKTGVAALQDSGRSRVMSWRERNQSAATLSSVASSAATSISSHSSITSATSSIYSTASAPAALTRKDFSSRNRTRGSGFGLDTISEREKTESAKKEVDAKYLAGIFGGGDNLAQGKKRKEESQRAAPSQQCGESAAAQAGVSVADKGETKGTKLFGLLTEGSSNGSKENGVMRSTSASSTKWVEPSSRLATIEAGVNGSAQRSVSISSVTSNSSSSGVAASFVSRFRRPATSSSSLSIVATTTSKANGSDAGGGFSDRQAQTFEAGRLESASLGMRRDVSTSTSSLHHVKHDETSATAREVVPTLSNGSCTISSVKTTEVGSSDSNDAASSSVSASASASAPVAAAAAVKKRSMGKFLLGVRDSIKNF